MREKRDSSMCSLGCSMRHHETRAHTPPIPKLSQDRVFQILMCNTLHESCLQWLVASASHRKVAYNITPQLMAGYTDMTHYTQADAEGYVCRWQRKRQSEKWTNIQGAVIENSESLRSLQMPELKQRQSPRSIMHARHWKHRLLKCQSSAG